MSTPSRFDRGHTDDLMPFLAASPTPYHAVANAAERLEKAGFRQVAETDAWEGTSGGKYVLRGVRSSPGTSLRAPSRTPRSGSWARTPTPPTCG